MFQPPSMIANPFSEIAERFRPDIENGLERCISELDQRLKSKNLTDMLRYHLGLSPYNVKASGKRLRGVLSMFIGRELRSPIVAVDQIALALEMTHAASLAHDDIQDRDEQRWNRPTLWAKYGVGSAINVGDTLTGVTYDMLGNLVNLGESSDIVLRMFDLFSTSFLKMTEGQQLDLDHEGLIDVTPQQYLYTVACKTASSFECSCMAPAVLSSQGPAIEEAFRTFGNSFGTIYQIADDVASLFDNKAATGKDAFGDMFRSKASLPLLYGRQLQKWDDSNCTPAERAKSLVVSQGAKIRELCAATAEPYIDRALRALQGLSDFNMDPLVELLSICSKRIRGRQL